MEKRVWRSVRTKCQEQKPNRNWVSRNFMRMRTTGEAKEDSVERNRQGSERERKPKEEEEEMEGAAWVERRQGALSPGRDGLAAAGQRAPAHPGARGCHADPQAVFVDVVFLRCFPPPHCSGLPSLLRWLPWAPYHSFAICVCHPTPRAAL